MVCVCVLTCSLCVCVLGPRRMFSELSSRVGVRTQREGEVNVREEKREWKKVCPRNLQMKREGFSLNAIKFFHFTASPADSFSSLGAQSCNATLSSRWDGRGCWVGGGERRGGVEGGKPESERKKCWQKCYFS